MVRKNGNRPLPPPRGPQQSPGTVAVPGAIGTVGVTGNGINDILKMCGTKCPECASPMDATNNRPLKELCGHLRCRKCLIKSPSCGQCVSSSSSNSNHDTQGRARLGAITNGSSPNGCTNNKNSALPPNRFRTQPPRRTYGRTYQNNHSSNSNSSSSSESTNGPMIQNGPMYSSVTPAYLETTEVQGTSSSRNVKPMDTQSVQISCILPNGLSTHPHPSTPATGFSHSSTPTLVVTSSHGTIPTVTTFTLAAVKVGSSDNHNHVNSCNSVGGTSLLPSSSSPSSSSSMNIQGSFSSSAASGSQGLNEEASSSSSSSGHSQDKKKKKRNPVVIHDHITVISGDPPKFQCNVCSKQFKTKAHIKYHEFCRNGEKPFKCGECGQGFIAKSHYEYHLRTHTGERPYVCPKCGKGFNQRGKVTRHMRSHTGEKPFVCNECGRGFANAQALRSHHLIHTGERPYGCKYCNKRFTGMTNLKKHIITHTGERPFVCTHCGKSFGLKWTLDLHLRTHSSERPYACDQCSRAFSNSKDLRRHLVIHSGERPFKCWICGTSFRRKDNLDRHIKNTHNQPKEVAKKLADEAAAIYLANNANSNETDVPVNKVNSAVISTVIRTAQQNSQNNAQRQATDKQSHPSSSATSRGKEKSNKLPQKKGFLKKKKPAAASAAAGSPTSESTLGSRNSTPETQQLIITARLSPGGTTVEETSDTEIADPLIVKSYELDDIPLHRSPTTAETSTENDDKAPEMNERKDDALEPLSVSGERESEPETNSVPGDSEVIPKEEVEHEDDPVTPAASDYNINSPPDIHAESGNETDKFTTTRHEESTKSDTQDDTRASSPKIEATNGYQPSHFDEDKEQREEYIIPDQLLPTGRSGADESAHRAAQDKIFDPLLGENDENRNPESPGNSFMEFRSDREKLSSASLDDNEKLHHAAPSPDPFVDFSVGSDVEHKLNPTSPKHCFMDFASSSSVAQEKLHAEGTDDMDRLSDFTKSRNLALSDCGIRLFAVPSLDAHLDIGSIIPNTGAEEESEQIYVVEKETQTCLEEFESVSTTCKVLIGRPRMLDGRSNSEDSLGNEVKCHEGLTDQETTMKEMDNDLDSKYEITGDKMTSIPAVPQEMYGTDEHKDQEKSAEDGVAEGENMDHEDARVVETSLDNHLDSPRELPPQSEQKVEESLEVHTGGPKIVDGRTEIVDSRSLENEGPVNCHESLSDDETTIQEMDNEMDLKDEITGEEMTSNVSPQEQDGTEECKDVCYLEKPAEDGAAEGEKLDHEDTPVVQTSLDNDLASPPDLSPHLEKKVEETLESISTTCKELIGGPKIIDGRNNSEESLENEVLDKPQEGLTDQETTMKERDNKVDLNDEITVEEMTSVISPQEEDSKEECKDVSSRENSTEDEVADGDKMDLASTPKLSPQPENKVEESHLSCAASDHEPVRLEAQNDEQLISLKTEMEIAKSPDNSSKDIVSSTIQQKIADVSDDNTVIPISGVMSPEIKFANREVEEHSSSPIISEAQNEVKFSSSPFEEPKESDAHDDQVPSFPIMEGDDYFQPSPCDENKDEQDDYLIPRKLSPAGSPDDAERAYSISPEKELASLAGENTEDKNNGNPPCSVMDFRSDCEKLPAVSFDDNDKLQNPSFNLSSSTGLCRKRKYNMEEYETNLRTRFYYTDESGPSPAYHPSQIRIQHTFTPPAQDLDNNINFVYATATAHAERDHDNTLKIRLLHAEALGVQESGECNSQQRLIYTCTQPNQVVDYESPNVALAPAAVIHPPSHPPSQSATQEIVEPSTLTPQITYHDYRYEENAIPYTSSSSSTRLTSQYPIEVSEYNNNGVHLQSVSDYPETTEYVSRARQAFVSYPESEYHQHHNYGQSRYNNGNGYWNTQDSFGNPVPIRDSSQQHHYYQGGEAAHGKGSYSNSNHRQGFESPYPAQQQPQPTYNALNELAAEATKRLRSFEIEDYNRQIATAAIIAKVGEQARKRREEMFQQSQYWRRRAEDLFVSREDQKRSDAPPRKGFF